jgi:hypothetical protein
VLTGLRASQPPDPHDAPSEINPGGIMPEAVIFDVDGTLIDSVDLHAKA